MILRFHARPSRTKRKLDAIRGCVLDFESPNHAPREKRNGARAVCNQFLFGVELIRVILLNYYVRRCIGSRFLVYRYIVFVDDVPDISHKSCGSHVCGGTRTSRTFYHLLNATSHIHGWDVRRLGLCACACAYRYQCLNLSYFSRIIVINS